MNTVRRVKKTLYAIRTGLIVLILSLLITGNLHKQIVSASTDSIVDKIDQEVFDAIEQTGTADLFVMMDTTTLYEAVSQSRSRQSQEQQVQIQTQVAAVATQREQLLSTLSATEYQPLQQYQSVPAVVGRILSEEALFKMASNPAVQRISLNGGGGSGSIAESAAIIGADVSYNNGYFGERTTVAVMDTGFDSDHPNLAGRLAHEACFLGTSDCPNGTTRQFGTGAAADDNGHGTFVTGIIAADAGSVAGRGIAPTVNIAAIKVLDSANRFQSTSDIVAAWDYIFTELPDVNVVNMSLGTDSTFDSACDDAYSWTQALAFSAQQLTERGTLLIASTGNNSSSTSLQAPSCISSVFAVGASTKSDTYASFSNSNNEVDVIAPGQSITSLNNGGGIRTGFGTSYSAPFVTACAALLHEAGTMSVEEIRTRLRQSDVQITNPANGITHPRLDCELPAEVETVRIEAENYFNQSDVGIISDRDGGGDIVGNINDGDYTQYIVPRFAPSGAVEVKVRATSSTNGGTISFILSGTNIGEITIPNTGGWDNYTTFSAEMTIPEGENPVLLLEYSGGDGSLFAINWIEITAIDETTVPPTPTPIPIPTSTPIVVPPETNEERIEAEAYSAQSGIRVVSERDGNDDVIGYINDGDSTTYNIPNLPASGSVEIAVRATSRTEGGTITFILNGANIGSITVPNTGGWEDYEMFSTDVTIPSNVQSPQTLQLEYSGDSRYLFDINWFLLTYEEETTQTATPTPPPSSTVLVSNQFTNGTECFGYNIGTFYGANEPDYASSALTADRLEQPDVVDDRLLELTVGGIDDERIEDMSAGWTCEFTLDRASFVSIEFDYIMDADPDYDSDEYSHLLLEIDGTFYGLNGNDYITEIVGGGTVGWTRETVTTSQQLSAGTHAVTIGVYNNLKTVSEEATIMQMDNVVIATTTGNGNGNGNGSDGSGGGGNAADTQPTNVALLGNTTTLADQLILFVVLATVAVLMAVQINRSIV